MVKDSCMTPFIRGLDTLSVEATISVNFASLLKGKYFKRKEFTPLGVPKILSSLGQIEIIYCDSKVTSAVCKRDTMSKLSWLRKSLYKFCFVLVQTSKQVDAVCSLWI